MASKTIGAAAAVAARRRGRPARSAQNVDTQRAAIVEAARTILVSAGLEAASARRIALAAGIAPATLYLYFENIEVLYAAVLGESLLQLQQYVRAATGDVPPPAKPAGDATPARARAAASRDIRPKGSGSRSMPRATVLPPPWNGAIPAAPSPSPSRDRTASR
ncbi:TetR family transcriptional regulator [Cupriavidus necator]|uniref:TetR/AcrR family transcriptional regulator n=1 Tax=Cupriavidus necator TaxID=106590 RepID=UPI003F7345F3